MAPVVQVCLSTITCILLCSITRVIFEIPERWSYVFGFLCAIDPLQLLYERYVMTETISLCLYAFVIYHSCLYLKNHRLRNLVIVQAVSVLLIGFRMSFLLQVQINTIILPLMAFAPDILKQIRRRPVAEASPRWPGSSLHRSLVAERDADVPVARGIQAHKWLALSS
jgi:hypothetical protein